MFKRRVRPSTLARLGRALWPRGGWIRAVWYVLYRIRRLPDPAYKISRGIAAGVFVSFTPLFGIHFLFAAGIAWLLGGNVLASLLATFVGNPLTFPLIAGSAVELGSMILGQESRLPIGQVLNAFSRVSIEIWDNMRAWLVGDPVEWFDVSLFYEQIFLPYLVGGTVIGAGAAVVSYMVTRPIIAAYQKARATARAKRLAARAAARSAAKGEEA